LLNNGKTGETHEVTISLDKTALTLKKGETAVLAAAVTPEGAGAEITWYSTDSDIATVSANGTVTAVQTGTADIVASILAGDDEKTATCAVTVPKDPGLHETGVPREAAGTSMADMFAWIAEHGTDDTAYTLVLEEDKTVTETIGTGATASLGNFIVPFTPKTGNKKNLTIILEGSGDVELTMIGRDSLFTVRGKTSDSDMPTLVLDAGITLRQR
jgi:hypothetical protein